MSSTRPQRTLKNLNNLVAHVHDESAVLWNYTPPQKAARGMHARKRVDQSDDDPLLTDGCLILAPFGVCLNFGASKKSTKRYPRNLFTQYVLVLLFVVSLLVVSFLCFCVCVYFLCVFSLLLGSDTDEPKSHPRRRSSKPRYEQLLAEVLQQRQQQIGAE